MTDFRALCAELLDDYGQCRYRSELHDRACAALAEQPVGPTDEELCETYLAGYYAEKNRQGPDCQATGLRAVLAKWGKAPLLAIADELEAHG